MITTALLAITLAQSSAAAEPAALKTPGGTLYGTLQIPSGKGPFPVVLMHAGSGPTDRDGNSAVVSGKNNNLKMLAEELAMHGIASLRYDKRGIAASASAMMKEEEMRFDTYVDDAVAWSQQLRKDTRFGKLVLLGHSEGALIMCLAAQKAGADGYISIAGPGSSASKTILEQLRPQLPPDLMKQAEDVVGSLNRGQTVANSPTQLAALFRPSVQPYLISWFKYDPSTEIAKLKMPVLIAQGETDIQVQIADAKALAAAQPAATLIIVPGMNHVFKMVEADRTRQLASYGDPSLPVAPNLLSAVVTFVEKVADK